jgi:hypothetical protein
MKRLRMLLAVVAATAVLVVAASPAMAGAFVGMGVDPDGFGQPWWPQQAVTVFDNFSPDCPSWVTPKWACW